MKNFNGKAIYQPSGKAAEYSKWACNFYVGCSNGCEYCYCKKGILAPVMGMYKPQLKKCFKDEEHAYRIFTSEVDANMNDLKEHGLFLSFTTDPCLTETIDLTIRAISYCAAYSIPIKVLTKKTGEWVEDFIEVSRRKFSINNIGPNLKKQIAFGFTLTGHDEMEPAASTNAERIEAMRKLHDAGFKTFASIEPIIDLESSWSMIVESFAYCDLFKIGLESGKKYDIGELIDFAQRVTHFLSGPSGTKIYFKDSLLKAFGINRESLPANCVSRDYNLFQNQ